MILETQLLLQKILGVVSALLFWRFKLLKQILNGPITSLPPENVGTGGTEPVELRTDSRVPTHSSFKRYKNTLRRHA